MEENRKGQGKEENRWGEKENRQEKEENCQEKEKNCQEKEENRQEKEENCQGKEQNRQGEEQMETTERGRGLKDGQQDGQNSNQNTNQDSGQNNRRESITLRMDSLSKNEEFARVVVAVFASRLDPNLEELDDIKTAVSEAVTNAVIHGYQNGEGIIELSAAAEDRVLTVSVNDQGVGIPDIERAMEPMYTTAPDGERSGMGFSFMEAFMDQVEVISAPGKGTTVIMRKKIGR